jgi:hypothetical protein
MLSESELRSCYSYFDMGDPSSDTTYNYLDVFSKLTKCKEILSTHRIPKRYLLVNKLFIILITKL